MRPVARAAAARAAVAAGLVGAALGSDGAGSIRIPAAWCGLFGLKPQRGRVSMAPRRGPGTGCRSTVCCAAGWPIPRSSTTSRPGPSPGPRPPAGARDQLLPGRRARTGPAADRIHQAGAAGRDLAPGRGCTACLRADGGAAALARTRASHEHDPDYGRGALAGVPCAICAGPRRCRRITASRAPGTPHAGDRAARRLSPPALVERSLAGEAEMTRRLPSVRRSTTS